MDATVLFADVSGSHKLIETAGNAVALKAIARCLACLSTAAESTGGRVVKTIGDEVMVLFDTPDAAVEAAAKMHASIDALPAVSGTKLAVHVGFHSGPVIQVEKDVLGDTVKLASKLVEQAQQGQTITSQQTAALLSPALQPLSRQLRSVPLGGGAGQGIRLCEIVPLAQAQDHAITRVRLTFRNYIVDCSRERSSILIGRDYRCGLVISDPTASRKHCAIELRGDQFVVQDHSTNGTYVTIEHEKAMLLKGENLPLRRYGWIGFSEVRSASSDVVQFSCA
jgi:adenylate cyclase